MLTDDELKAIDDYQFGTRLASRAEAGLLDRHLPGWKHMRDKLNAAPLAHVNWDY